MSTRTVAVAVILLLATTFAGAQSPTGSISGTIADESAAAVPAATVTVTNQETSVSRTLAANNRGRYRALDLAPGIYSVAVELQGFAPASQRDIAVKMGADAVVDLTLKIAAVGQEVTVTETAQPLDARTSALGGVVTTRQIAELPLNGRSFIQLATLQPGVIVSRATGREFTTGFGSTQLSIAGARPEHTGYLMDGTNISDIADKAPSSVAGVLLGVDTIREFSVQTHGFSAEFGRAAGGVISAVTKSGTNRFHGSAFEFHRDSVLDARNFFDVGDPPAFDRNQFGGTLGGPLKRNSLFFFGSYEGLRDRQAVTRIARVPDRLAHEGFLPNATGALQNVGVHPLVRPYLDLLFPIPDGQSFGDGTAELRHAHRDPTDQDFVVGKLDWQASSADSFVARFSRDVSDARYSQEHPLFVNVTGTDTRYATAQHQRIFSSNLLNTVRFAINRTMRDDDLVPTVDIPPSLYFTEDPRFGAINVVGLSLAGSTAATPALYDQHVYQLADAVTWSRGTHLLKSGFDWQRYHFDGYSYSRFGGEFRFRNLREFLTLQRSSTAQADRFTGNLPGTDTQRRMRQHYVSFFVQDDWQAARGLTMNLGLRYDVVTTPKELGGRVAGLLSLDDLESGPKGVTPGAPLFDNPSKRSLAPRLGFAWNPTSDNRTTVRGGYGLFYQPLTVSFYRATAFRVYPYFAGVDIRQPAVFGPGLRDVLAQGTGLDVQRRSEFIFYDAKQPFMQQWHAEVRKEFGGMMAEIGYIGSKGHNLPFYGDPNAAPSEYLADGSKRVIPGATLRYPSWGRIRTRINIARSISHGLIAGISKRFADGLMFQASYTYGNTRDTWSGGQSGTADFNSGAGSATDWWDPEAEYGPASFDVRHTFVLNGVYELPWGGGLTGVAGLLAKGWHVGGLLQVASGLPFTPLIGFDQAGDLQSDADTIQKPDQIGPVTYPRTPEAWFDVTAFALPAKGYYGNARRNSLHGPGLKVADLTVFKNIPLGRVTAQVRLEAFNAFNWVNLGLPNAAVLFNTDGTYRAGAGRITTTATAARQVQVGLKFIF